MLTEANYYTFKDVEKIGDAKTVEEVVEIALEIFERMPTPIFFIMGAITSGKNSSEENKTRLRNIFSLLKKKNASAPNYLPLLTKAKKILHGESGVKAPKKNEGYVLQLRLQEDFYKPILFRMKGRIKLALMPMWESSSNCWIIRRFALENKIRVFLIQERSVVLAKESAENQQK